jgi:hypothetical protein
MTTSVQDRITAAFIDLDPVELDIWRPGEDITDGAGGHTEGPATIVASKTFKLIQQSRSNRSQTSQTFTGTVETPDYVIVSTTDFRFARGDFFTWNGFEYKIGSVHELPAYESKADVYRGKAVPGEG